MLSTFTSAIMTEEMPNQLVKNLTFLVRQLIPQCDGPSDETIVKVYKKASFIGRKILGEITESSATKLDALVNFFAVSVQLFASLP